jgi:hypothetical protein
MTKFVMRGGHPVSEERAAIIDAQAAGLEPPVFAKPDPGPVAKVTRVASTPGPVSNKARRAIRAAAAAEVELTTDGKPKNERKIKALLPKNVDHEGKVIEDEETLARIAANTAAIEAARVAAAEASAGSDDETVTTEPEAAAGPDADSGEPAATEPAANEGADSEPSEDEADASV